MKIIREKKHRLPIQFYQGFYKISFTLCIKDRKDFFVNESLFKTFEGYLLGKLETFKCEASVYLFMPDHAHLILAGTSENSELKKCMDRFKQSTGFWMKNNASGIKWQKDYYDHIIRGEEDFRNQLKYILFNPVRQNLVSDWKDYKYKGSTILDLNDFELTM
jgi:putative transposase